MPTATGLRISAVNGTAFLDNCPADVLAAVGLGKQIKIYDASSRYLQGVIDVAGSSETTVDYITGDDSTFASDTGFWTKTVASVSITGDVCRCVNTPDVNGIKKTGVAEVYITTGKLYYYSFDLTVSLRSCSLWIGGGSGAIATYNTNGTKIGYLTGKSGSSSSGIFLYATGTSTWDADNLIVREITAPSANGVIIKDLSGNQNFISKNASFTYNAASYTYEIISAGNAFNYFQNMMR